MTLGRSSGQPCQRLWLCQDLTPRQPLATRSEMSARCSAFAFQMSTDERTVRVGARSLIPAVRSSTTFDRKLAEVLHRDPHSAPLPSGSSTVQLAWRDSLDRWQMVEAGQPCCGHGCWSKRVHRRRSGWMRRRRTAHRGRRVHHRGLRLRPGQDSPKRWFQPEPVQV
jgi:hypothetical protein